MVGSGFWQAECERYQHEISRLESANAELLEALEDCLKWLGWETRPQCKAETLMELCDNTRAAIAKARGGPVLDQS